MLWIFASWVTFAVLYAGGTLDERRVYFGGDQAELLRHADDTLQGQPPLVGAQSRGGVFHPGPLFVYLLAMVHLMAGRHEAVTISAISLICATSVLFLQLLTLRLSRSLILSVSLPFLFVFNHAFLLYMRLLWNVTIVYPALAAAFWLIASLGPTRPWAFPALIAVLSLAAQSHMAFVPIALWLGVVAAGTVCLTRSVTRSGWMASGGVLLLTVLPVVWEAATHRGGNLAALAAHFTHQHETHSARELGAALGSLAAESLPGTTAFHMSLLAACLCSLVVGAVRRTPASGEIRLQLVVLSGAWISLVLSLRAIPESIQIYYLRPVWVLFAATLIAGTSALFSLTRRRSSTVGLASVLAGVLIVVTGRPAVQMKREFSASGWNTIPLSEVREVTMAVRSRLVLHGVQQAALTFDLGDLAGVEPSFLYLLQRAGVARTHAGDAPEFRIGNSSSDTPASWAELMRTQRYSVAFRPPTRTDRALRRRALEHLTPG